MGFATLLGAAMRLVSICLLLGGMGLVTDVRADTYYLIVEGLGGEPRYAERFAAQAESLAHAAQRSLRGDSRVSLLSGDAASRESIASELQRLAEVATPGDSLVVFLIGHGTHDGDQYKFNLPGPDIDGETLAELLDGVSAGQQVVVNATSASGAILELWLKEGRTLITATKTGGERNATRFGQYWAEALSSDEADANKNGAITAQEAFDFTARKVADSYEREGTLATEHPQLMGETAGAFNVALLENRIATTRELERLFAELDTLESGVELLRQRREEMESDVYLDELQGLLLELALVQREIDGVRSVE